VYSALSLDFFFALKRGYFARTIIYRKDSPPCRRNAHLRPATREFRFLPRLKPGVSTKGIK
jgi:hypothetical protein